MPSTVELLPDEIVTELNVRLKANRFSGYSELTEWLNSQGFQISRAALGRYAHDKLKPLLESIQRSTEMARAIADSMPDDEGKVNEGMIRLVQERIFQLLMDTESSGTESSGKKFSPKDLAELAKAIAQTVGSSVRAKEYKAKVLSKATAVAAEVEASTKAAGLSDQAAAIIVNKILGIAS